MLAPESQSQNTPVWLLLFTLGGEEETGDELAFSPPPDPRSAPPSSSVEGKPETGKCFSPWTLTALAASRRASYLSLIHGNLAGTCECVRGRVLVLHTDGRMCALGTSPGILISHLCPQPSNRL